MNKEILMAVDAVSNEKGVEKEIIFDALEAAALEIIGGHPVAAADVVQDGPSGHQVAVQRCTHPSRIVGRDIAPHHVMHFGRRPTPGAERKLTEIARRGSPSGRGSSMNRAASSTTETSTTSS